MSEPVVRLRDVSKRFADVVAVDHVNLDILDGEFLTLLGPSGSGKTTVLRLIAGFALPTAGRVEINGRDATNDPPYLRDVNTVFQDYALFPHMTVAANVEYGLRVTGVPRPARAAAAADALARVELSGYDARKPNQLSGGQRQRVALARALVNEPRVLLLDEPLGALDLKLRRQMQLELKSIQRQLGITFVFVTHDQEEALTMSDRIVVFNAGGIVQAGTPQAIYERPATPFVADFIGTMNTFASAEGRQVCIRPERIELLDAEPATGASVRARAGVTVESAYLGASRTVIVRTDDGTTLTVSIPARSDGSDITPGQRVWCAWEPDSEFIIN
ncbi:MAG: ATP-binding cassette domain-containing protein [Actinomycetales bacterium]|nr:ATP-binding cassette domain-containing protein [Actinomycetales bacterium]